MSIVSWVILGLIAGAVAKFILPGRDPGGVVVTTLIGVAGSFVGGWLATRFLHRHIATHIYDPMTWLAAVAGSLVLLVLYRIFFGNSRE